MFIKGIRKEGEKKILDVSSRPAPVYTAIMAKKNQQIQKFQWLQFIIYNGCIQYII